MQQELGGWRNQGVRILSMSPGQLSEMNIVVQGKSQDIQLKFGNYQ